MDNSGNRVKSRGAGGLAVKGRRVLTLTAKLAYAEKWLVLGILVGVGSGLFALGFLIFLKKIVALAGAFIGAVSPSGVPGGEADLSALLLRGGFDKLRLILVLLTGVAVSSALVYKLAPEAEGHGTDAAVAAFHRRAAIIPFSVPLVKLVASGIAIGTGSSGGVEGPSVQMGAGIGSTLARILHLPLHDRRIMLASGIAGALSALFRAPIGASFFAVEVLYKRDLEASALMPSLVSSIVSYSVTASYFHYQPILPLIPVSSTIIYKPGTLLYLLALGVFVAPFAWLYVKVFRASKKWFDSLVENGYISIYLKPVIGALLASILIVAFPIAAGSGRGVLAAAIEGSIVNYLPLRSVLPVFLVLIIAAIVKIVATSLSIGSGASGGVYAPGLLAGALLGLSFHTLVQPDQISPHLSAYVGMAAFFGAAAKVPLAVSIMVGEMGGNYLLIAPTLISAYIAREIVGNDSIYESQILRRLHGEAVTAEGLLVLLRNRGIPINLKVKSVMDTTYRPIHSKATLREALRMMMEERGKPIPVIDGSGRILGVLDPEDLDNIIEDLGGDLDVRLENVKLRVPPIVDTEALLDHVLETMVEHATEYAIVTDPDGRYRGLVTLDDVSAALAYILSEAAPPGSAVLRRRRPRRRGILR